MKQGVAKAAKEQEPKSAFVFRSERGGAPFTRDSFNWSLRSRHACKRPLDGIRCCLGIRLGQTFCLFPKCIH